MPPILAAIYQEKPNKTCASMCFHPIWRRELGNLSQSRDDWRRKSRLPGWCIDGTWVALFHCGRLLDKYSSRAGQHRFPIKRGGL